MQKMKNYKKWFRWNELQWKKKVYKCARKLYVWDQESICHSRFYLCNIYTRLIYLHHHLWRMFMTFVYWIAVWCVCAQKMHTRKSELLSVVNMCGSQQFHILYGRVFRAFWKIQPPNRRLMPTSSQLYILVCICMHSGRHANKIEKWSKSIWKCLILLIVK